MRRAETVISRAFLAKLAADRHWRCLTVVYLRPS